MHKLHSSISFHFFYFYILLSPNPKLNQLYTNLFLTFFSLNFIPQPSARVSDRRIYDYEPHDAATVHGNKYNS